MDKLISCCGLVCSECPAYVARKRNDDNLRREAAATWSEMYDAEIKPEDMNCDGCTAAGGAHFTFCSQCEVRACCLGHGLDNCALCDDYSCDKLDKLHQMATSARDNLDEIRARRDG